MSDLDLIMSQADLIASAMVKRLYPIQDELSAREAYKAFGRGWVDRAVRELKVRPRRSGNKTVFSRTELDALLLLERQEAQQIVKLVKLRNTRKNETNQKQRA